MIDSRNFAEVLKHEGPRKTSKGVLYRPFPFLRVDRGEFFLEALEISDMHLLYGLKRAQQFFGPRGIVIVLLQPPNNGLLASNVLHALCDVSPRLGEMPFYDVPIHDR
jgi:hypothetical protein